MGARIFIDGEAGTTGLGIRERLAGHSGIEVRGLPDAQRKDIAAKQALLREVDLVILCLPDAAALETVALAEALPSGPRLLDASTAHRTAPGWVYGFPEMAPEQASAIRAARRVSNPGCYATGAVALLRPLVDAGVLPADARVAINAVSGYSGGGKAMIADHERGHAPAFELYALDLAHKHVPEIMAHSGLTRRPIFVPSVGSFAQGMLVSIPLFLDDLPGRPSAADLADVLAAHYGSGGQPDVGQVRVVPAGTVARLKAEARSDKLELHVFAGDRQAVLVAKLDNLGKGASGAAVQNMALMLGI